MKSFDPIQLEPFFEGHHHIAEFPVDARTVAALPKHGKPNRSRRVTLQRLLAERLAEREKLEVQWNPHFELNDAVSAYLANPRAKVVGLYDRIAGGEVSLGRRRTPRAARTGNTGRRRLPPLATM